MKNLLFEAVIRQIAKNLKLFRNLNRFLRQEPHWLYSQYVNTKLFAVFECFQFDGKGGLDSSLDWIFEAEK